MPTNIELPQAIFNKYPLERGFSYAQGQEKIESRFESGAVYSKLTNIRVNDTFRASFLFTENEADIFMDFFIDTLEKGTKTFNWRHPRTGGSIEVYMIGTPTLAQAGGGNWVITCNFEIVGEN